MKIRYRFSVLFSSLFILLFLAAISGCDSQALPPNECDSCPPAANAQAVCVDGHCALACDEGFADCDTDYATGCEIDLDTDPSCTIYSNLGNVSGDQGAVTVTASAAGERWYRINVTEDDLGAACQYLSLTIRLTPGAGTDYDLSAGCDSCSAALVSSSHPGTAEEAVELSWDEGCFLGTPTGSDSGRTILIRVNFVSGDNCNNFTLTVTGNTDVAVRTCSEL